MDTGSPLELFRTKSLLSTVIRFVIFVVVVVVVINNNNINLNPFSAQCTLAAATLKFRTTPTGGTINDIGII